MKTAIVFLIFNRPHTTRKVFEIIKQVKPPQLFIVADGARQEKPDEFSRCQKTRNIAEQVDWKCEVFKNYSDVNLGGKNRISSGLDWVFNQIDEAIILEDDCLPHLSFFRFCEDLLAYYRDDQRIMMISGNNFQFGTVRNPYSYYFSRYTHIWGWATWKRAWQHYDINMSLWPEVKNSSWLKTILDDQRSLNYWSKIFQKCYEGSPYGWDYRWTLACWLQSGLTILPNVNLVSNIGFGEDASHTTVTNNLANLPVKEMNFPLRHPPTVIRDFEADNYSQHHIFQKRLIDRIQAKLNTLIQSHPL